MDENMEYSNIFNKVDTLSILCKKKNKKIKESIIIGKVIGQGIKIQILADKPKINYERWKDE